MLFSIIHGEPCRKCLNPYIWSAVFAVVYAGLPSHASADWRIEPFVELHQPDVDDPLRATTLVFAPDGTLYIGTGPHAWPSWQNPVQLQRVLPGGQTAEPFGPAFGRVEQLAYDSTGKVAGSPGLLLIDDSPFFLQPNGITAVSIDGVDSILPGTRPTSVPFPRQVRPETLLERPTDLHVTADGKLYVVDAGFLYLDESRRFQRYDPQAGLIPIPLTNPDGSALNSPLETLTLTDDPRHTDDSDRFLTSGSVLLQLDGEGRLDQSNPLAEFKPSTRRIHVAPNVGPWADQVAALTERGLTVFQLSDVIGGGASALDIPLTLSESYTFSALGLPADSSVSDFAFGPDGFAYFSVQPARFGGEQIHPGFSGVVRLVPEPSAISCIVFGLFTAFSTRRH